MSLRTFHISMEGTDAGRYFLDKESAATYGQGILYAIRRFTPWGYSVTIEIVSKNNDVEYKREKLQ